MTNKNIKNATYREDTVAIETKLDMLFCRYHDSLMPDVKWFLVTQVLK